MFRKFLIAIVVSVFSFSLYNTIEKNRFITLDINNDIKIKMSLRDKKILEQFFKELCLDDPFLYTLFGVKPISFSGYWKQTLSPNWRIILSAISPQESRLRRGWKTWENYAPLFKTSRFLLWKEESNFSPNSCFIVLADRNLVHQVLNQHSEEFSKRLNRTFSSEKDLFSQVGHQCFFKDTLKNDQVLMGVLLGYGKSNAELYDQTLKQPSLEAPSFWEKSIYEEFFKNKSSSLDPSKTLCIPYPFFMGDPATSESLELRRIYLNTRKEIAEYFKNKDFLVTVLGLLATN